MRKITLLALLLFVFTCMPLNRAWGQSPHFVSDSDTLGPADPEDLRVSFKEAGLGNDVTISYTASANATATYACVNKGGNHPQASNKETVSGPVSASGSFASGKNGAISQSLTMEEPASGSFSCPGGQALVLGSVSYTDVRLCDTSDNLCESLPQESKTFCDVDNLTKATVKNCLTPQ